MAILKLTNISKTYSYDGGITEALQDINLQCDRSLLVTIVGASGCGKTTLLNIIGGLDRCTSGDISLYGRSTSTFTTRDWDSYRNGNIGFVFQQYNLIEYQTVLNNVMLPHELAGNSNNQCKVRAATTS